MVKLVCGVGVNDADYDVTAGVTINGKWVITWICPYYQRWKSMLKRCYSNKYKDKNKTYLDCSVASEWLTFSNFREWMHQQDWEGMELDKDLLFVGNKIYSPATCAFVPSYINKFTTAADKSRGNHPIGVYYSASRNKFRAECRDPISGKAINLGDFKCASDAHNAWKKKKNEIACKLADLHNGQAFAEALRKRYA